MIIDTILLLATEAKEAAAEGFGINTDILGTNLFNLSILLGLVIFYGRKVLGQILGERQSKIAEALAEAEMQGSLISSEIAEPYAQALLSVAQSSGQLEAIGGEIKSLLELLENAPDLRAFIGNPVIKEEAKKAVLSQVMGSSANPYLTNFMMLLVDKRRIQFLEPVCQQYLTLARVLTNTVLAEVSSATELNDSQKQIVIDKVKTLTGANVVELKTKVDGSLIGGVVIKVGSQVFDASIRGQLQRLSLSLR